jgi:hypothetical protein
MKGLRAIAIFAIGIFLLAGFAGTVSAGVEPSPFRSDAGKLEAIINNLESIEKRLEHTLVVPPDDIRPGTANKLAAMNSELGVVEKRLEYMHSKREVETGQIQGYYIGAHEVGHSLLSFVDEYVEEGFEDMNIVHEIREMYLKVSNLVTLLESYIRPDRV